MFLILFSGTIAIYGLSVPAISQQLQAPINCEVNNTPRDRCEFPLYSPPLAGNATTTQASQSAPFPQCLLFFVSCFTGAVSTITNTGQAIWAGLQQVAYAAAYADGFAFIFINKAIQAVYLIFGITQIMSQDFGIPILSYFWVALIIFYIMYGFSMLKPGGSGLS
jgi:hypothetical protein